MTQLHRQQQNTRRDTRQAKQRVSQNRVSTVLARELINSDTRTKTRTGKFCNTCVQHWFSRRYTKKKTWEASTLTGVLREQTRRDKNNLTVSSTCNHLNTDRKDVAMSHEFWPHLHTPKNLLKQIQRCFSLSSDSSFTAFLMSQ